jgi:hypothetical protein
MIGRSQLPNALRVERSRGLPAVNLSIAALASDDRRRLTVRVVNLNSTAVTACVAIAGGSAWAGTATTLSGKLDGHNTPERPVHVVPTEAPVTAAQLASGLMFDGYSFTVLNLTRLTTDDHGKQQTVVEILSKTSAGDSESEAKARVVAQAAAPTLQSWQAANQTVVLFEGTAATTVSPPHTAATKNSTRSLLNGKPAVAAVASPWRLPAVDWDASPGEFPTHGRNLSFGTRAVDCLVWPSDRKTYCYADLPLRSNPGWPAGSYGVSIGVFSSADGRSRWEFGGVAVHKNVSGSADSGGLATPSCLARTSDGMVFVYFSFEGGPPDYKPVNSLPNGPRGIGIARAAHPLGPFVRLAPAAPAPPWPQNATWTHGSHTGWSTQFANSISPPQWCSNNTGPRRDSGRFAGAGARRYLPHVSLAEAFHGHAGLSAVKTRRERLLRRVADVDERRELGAAGRGAEPRGRGAQVRAPSL